ncbi:MAG: hypothetical protein A3K10_11905 [Bacteroidetes bacterium RIFCSPLOWO2_12_FULL_31_6]|nr:MAG: hypothetical protein A3K10_11905 [Bacteroidetes bacterium RIFCSPLOWO2_12_FULL_31_6]
MLVDNIFSIMKIKSLFTFSVILSLLLCAGNSFAQEVDAFDSVAALTTKGVVIEENLPSTPPNTATKAEETTPAIGDGNSDEGNKNFGPVFDGAYVSLSVGMNVYFGDIAAYKLFPRPSQFGDHITGAFKFTVGREIKWGLGAQFNYQRGSLIGTRKTGKNSSTVSFQNKFYDMSLQVNYRLNDVLFKKNEYNRFTLYGHIGLGMMWYRTQLYDTETLNTKDYEGYIEVEGTEGLAQKTLSDKTKKASTLTVPYGIRLNYKYNYKMDFHFDFTQTTTFTDRLDAFSRDWTARDKYDYIGVGITYNFNRSKDDEPKKREKEVTSDTNDDSSKVKPNDSGNRLFSGKKKQSKGEEDELLNIRLKLFETQLKLFEMQYLLGK